MKPLGQVNASFIVAVNGEGLWIVDQHVAHERVLFEQHLEARRAGKIEAQRMLMPLVIELSPRQIVTFEKIAGELGANGFGDLHRNVASENRGVDGVPCGDQGEDAARALENGVAARRVGKNRLPHELPTWAAGGAAVFHQRN